MKKLTATVSFVQVSSLGAHYSCRLHEAGGYKWHGQTAHTSFNTSLTIEQFKVDCLKTFHILGIANEYEIVFD